MSIDRRLRQTFHRTAPAVTPNAWDGLSDVLTRRRRRRQIQLVALAAAVVLIAVAAIAGRDIWDAIRADSTHPPAEQPAELPDVPQSLPGLYTMTLPATSRVVLKHELAGRWRLRLRTGMHQDLRLTADEHQSVADPDAPTFIPTVTGSYEVSGSRFVTDVLANTTWCQGDARGTYLWRRSGSMLELTVVDDSCAARRTLLAGQIWRRGPPTQTGAARQLIATYRTKLEGGRKVTGAESFDGRWTMGLRPDGRLILTSPPVYDPFMYGRLNDMYYRTAGRRNRIAIIRGFVGHCTGFGIYEWRLQRDRLRLEVVEDECAPRRFVFGSRPWVRT